MRRRKRFVRKRRWLPSRALRRAARQLAEMPAWLKVVMAALILGFVALTSFSGSWGVLELLKLVGTTACVAAAVITALVVFENRGTE